MSIRRFFKGIFWNSEQRRMRTLWRIATFVLLMTVSAFVLQALAGAVLALLGGPERPNDLLAVLDVGPGFLTAVLTLLATFIALPLAAKWLDRRPFSDYGLHIDRVWWRHFLFGLGLGAALMVLIFATEYAAGWVSITDTLVTAEGLDFVPGILAMLLLFVCVGIYEELLFRGYLLTNLAEGFNFRVLGPRRALAVAWLFSSALFGLAHASNPNATTISTANIMVAGIFLGLGFVLSGEMAIPIGIHITWNFFQGNVFGFPVSGTNTNRFTFLGIRQGGPDLWTGGAFGPEAGVLGLLAMLLGSLAILLWLRREGRRGLNAAIAEAPALQPHPHRPDAPAG